MSSPDFYKVNILSLSPESPTNDQSKEEKTTYLKSEKYQQQQWNWKSI